MKGRKFTQEFVANLKTNLFKLMSHNNSQVPAASSTAIDNSKLSPEPYPGLKHPPILQSLKNTQTKICDVLPLAIPVNDRQANGSVSGFLHLPHDYTSTSLDRVETAAILLSGAGGGVVGPSSIYLSMGDKLASLNHGIPTLRLDYRFPARNRPCSQDVVSAMNFLRTTYQISRFVLVGWSFGSAPVFTVAATQPDSVVGCATIAGQTAETSGVRALYPKPLLLLHGTGDRILSPRCSQALYDDYGSKSNGDRTIHLFPDDDHALTQNSQEAESLLCAFIARCAGVEIGAREQHDVVEQKLVDDSAKVELMKKGGDLRGAESIE